MNLKENNILIADFRKLSNYTDNECFLGEFMGYKLEPINKPYISIETPTGSKINFKSDWNWLMEVVQKIESLGYDFNILTPTIIDVNKDGKTFIYIDGNRTKIDAIYKGCIEFVKWYNKQKK